MKRVMFNFKLVNCHIWLLKCFNFSRIEFTSIIKQTLERIKQKAELEKRLENVKISKDPRFLEIKKEFKKTHLLVVGEIHGIKENYKLYMDLVKSLNIELVGFE